MVQESGRNACVAYVYIRYSERAAMSVPNILEVFIKQILERRQDALPIADLVYAPYISDGKLPTESQLLGLVRQLTSEVPTTFVLDALDEAPIEIPFDLFRSLASLNCKIFITSRPLAVIEEQFPGAQRFPIVATEGDVDLLIKKRLERNPHLQAILGKVDESVRQDVLDTIKRKCGGM
jgi:hypothetical protein